MRFKAFFGVRLTVKWVDFEPVGSGGPVWRPFDAEGVVTHVVCVQIGHVQVHYGERNDRGQHIKVLHLKTVDTYCKDFQVYTTQQVNNNKHGSVYSIMP